MKRPRPTHLAIGGLALAAALKLGFDLAPEMPEGPIHVAKLFGAAEASSTPKPAEPTEVAAPAPEPAQCDAPEAMLDAIAGERGLLEKQKAKLADRAAEIELAEEGLKLEKARLQELKSDVESLLQRVEEHHNADLDRLIALYRNMKPQVAAGIMDEMDLEVSVMVLGAMPERDAAQIFASLSLVRARAISKIILERSKLPGDQDLTGIKLQ